MRSDLVKAGLVEHTANSHWTPSQQATWLDFNLDLEAGLVSFLGEKIDALKTQLQQVHKDTSVRAKTLASVIGKVISISLATGPFTMTRGILMQILPISKEARDELEFWLDQIDNLNGQGI